MIMKSIRSISAILAVILAFAAQLARATDEHVYARGEYAIIRGGLAPDRRLALASHGECNGGCDQFHVWLMTEPAHRKLTALDEIGDANNLDTAPMAYHAMWSDNSRRVAVKFRSNRRVVQLNLYAIENRRARLIAGPNLFRQATGRDVVVEQDDLRSSFPEIAWTGPDRFRLTEYRGFVTSDPEFARLLGQYGKVEKLDDGRLFVEFAAEADCVVMPGHRYRVVDLRVGKFVDPDTW